MSLLPPRERRERLVRVTQQWVGVLLVDGARVTVEVGLPEDAEIVGVWWSDVEACWYLRVWHESFDPVTDDGCAPPCFSPQYRVERVSRAGGRGIRLADAVEAWR